MNAVGMAVLLAVLGVGTAPGGHGAVGPGGGLQARGPMRVAKSTADATVEVRLLSKHQPSRLRLDGPRSLEVVASGDTLIVNGRAGPSPLLLDSGRWRVRGKGLDRRYEAALSLAARAGALVVVATFALETYVAAVTASETEVDTPFEALRAQAITARSYALASGGATRRRGPVISPIARSCAAKASHATWAAPAMPRAPPKASSCAWLTAPSRSRPSTRAAADTQPTRWPCSALRTAAAPPPCPTAVLRPHGGPSCPARW